MTSYISTQSISSSMRQSILRMQSELAASQTEIATGNYADIGLTLGSRTGDSVSLQAENSLLQTITNTNQTVTSRLDTTQTILSGLRTSAQTLLNSLIEGTGSNTNASSIQASGQSDLQGLISGLNSTLSGDFIFAGTNTIGTMYQNSYAEHITDNPKDSRDRERQALEHAIGLLQKAEAAGPRSLESVEALGFVGKLWNAFIQDLVDPESDLPDVLRADLLSVGLWIIKEAALIRSGQSKNFRGVIEICSMIRDGLK